MSIFLAFIGAFLAAGSFGLLYNIRNRTDLFWAAINGGMGGMAYQIAINTGQTVAMASFCGALAASIGGEILARTRRKPVLIFDAPALIPLVPGGSVYRMMLALLREKIYEGLQYGLEAMMIAGMIVMAISLVSGLTTMIFKAKHRLDRTKLAKTLKEKL